MFLSQIPNSLTILRIFIAPLLVVCFFLIEEEWRDVAMTSLFVVGVVTDFLDGQLARFHGKTSALGAFLDPVADKILVVVALLLLLYDGRGDFLPTVIIVCREICISALREWLAISGLRAAGSVVFLGKLKMLFQSVAIGLLLYQAPLLERVETVAVGNVLLWIAAVMTVASFLSYAMSSLRAARRRDS